MISPLTILVDGCEVEGCSAVSLLLSAFEEGPGEGDLLLIDTELDWGILDNELFIADSVMSLSMPLGRGSFV